MKYVLCAFEFNDRDKVTICHTKLSVKILFDIKTIKITRKSRLVTGRHHIDPQKYSVYSSVVSREIVRLAFLATALSGLDILATDIQNTYLNTPTKRSTSYVDQNLILTRTAQPL